MFGALAVGVLTCVSGCDSDHVPSQAELKQSEDNRLKALAKIDMPEVQKRTIEAQMGGRAYQNPAIAAAMAAAKAHGAQIPNGRP